jgi:hypothetical protein
MSNRQGADARRDATSGQIVCSQGRWAAALDPVIEVRALEGQLQARSHDMWGRVSWFPGRGLLYYNVVCYIVAFS